MPSEKKYSMILSVVHEREWCGVWRCCLIVLFAVLEISAPHFGFRFTADLGCSWVGRGEVAAGRIH